MHFSVGTSLQLPGRGREISGDELRADLFREVIHPQRELRLWRKLGVDKRRGIRYTVSRHVVTGFLIEAIDFDGCVSSETARNRFARSTHLKPQ